LWTDYQTLGNARTADIYKKTYLALENIALDYRFNEKVKDLLVLPATFDWMDLGSFHDMYEAVDHDEAGNHVQGAVELDSVENSYIYNDTEKPVAVIGLDNVVVVQTPHGLLVARKDLSQAVGTLSKRFKQGN
jgi:mannose-1-phosphate guanylyltransferase